MPHSAVMLVGRTAVIGVEFVGDDKELLRELPKGASVEFVSDNPDVVEVVAGEDGKHAEIRTKHVGSATVRVSPIGFREPFHEDTYSFQVIGPRSGTLNLTLGEVQDDVEWKAGGSPIHPTTMGKADHD